MHVLPTGSSARIAAFGSVSGGQIASLGGFATTSASPCAHERGLPEPGWRRRLHQPAARQGAWRCRRGRPAAGERSARRRVNGYFLYTDANGATPWSLELGGTVAVLGNQVGSAKLLIKGTGAIDFEVNVGFSSRSSTSPVA